MLERPEIADETIAAAMRDAYGLRIAAVSFLPLGADTNTAVFRIEVADTTPYLLKLRRGGFNEIAVTIPRFLHDAGVPHIIAPVATATGALWAHTGGYAATLSPFIAGRDGFAAPLSVEQCCENPAWYGPSARGPAICGAVGAARRRPAGHP